VVVVVVTVPPHERRLSSRRTGGGGVEGRLEVDLQERRGGARVGMVLLGVVVQIGEVVVLLLGARVGGCDGCEKWRAGAVGNSSRLISISD